MSLATSELDALSVLINWPEADTLMAPISDAAKGEQGWPPLCLLKALLLARWYDLSDVKLAEALDDRASFRRFCGLSRNEATPGGPLSCAFAVPSPGWILARGCSK